MLYLNEFLNYVRSQLGYLARLGELHLNPDIYPLKVLLASLYAATSAVGWQQFGPQLREYLLVGPFTVVCALWGIDMFTGIVMAVRRRQWSPTRMAWGVFKLILWCCALLVAWLLRNDGYPVTDVFSPLIEVSIILTEASSVLRNIAELMESITGKKSRILAFFAQRMDSEIERLTSRVEVAESMVQETEKRTARHSQEIANALQHVQEVQLAQQQPSLPPVVVVERVEALISPPAPPAPPADSSQEVTP